MPNGEVDLKFGGMERNGEPFVTTEVLHLNKFSSFVDFLCRLENAFFRKLFIKYFELTRSYSFTQ